MTENDQITQGKIQAELVGTYLNQSRIGVFCAIGLVPYLGLSFYDKVELHRIIAWMLSVFLIDSYIVYTSLQYNNNLPQEKINFFKSRQQVLHMLAGVAWGLAFTMLLHDNAADTDGYRVAVCLAVVIAFSASTMSASVEGLLGFIVPLTVLTMAYFLAHFEHYAWWTFGLLGLASVAAYFGWMTHKFILGQIENRFLSDDYTLKLETLNKKIEETNFNLVMRNQELLDVQAKLEVLATHDELTGLYSRRYIVQRLKEKLPEAKRHQLPCCVVMMDVDFFKQVNDQYGHAAGDDVLRTLAQLLEGELRQGDLVARYGGEEFLILLPLTEIGAAQALVERLRDLIASQQYRFEGKNINVTASFGITTMVPHDSADKMIDRADQAMFEAKRAGRNCVVVFADA